ncbi:MAG: Uncharacterized protein XD54_0160 [Thermococcus sibiricus]|uniref:Lipoprotein n=1 Tax=Thermococcus sibiricus TaxID=172049 RepID=A0A101EP84_9EURY|nr:MAG: Uncharacterized protein XD54_0160 [Thermococcus sibiricus]KUK29390.1 MAG: Uncharacterized protein XD61_0036 [Thermococcus sp. 40_45]
MGRTFALSLILIIMVSFSACIQKEPTPQNLANEIEDVDKYMYSLEYHLKSPYGNSSMYYRGGFNYDKAEAFWEGKIIHSNGDVVYINETIIEDFMYFSYATERNNKIINSYIANMTIQEYFEKLKDRLPPNIKTVEDLRYEIFKRADLRSNPLYYIREALNNVTNFETTKGDGIYLVAFNFTKIYEMPIPENISAAEMGYYESIKHVTITKSFMRLWVKDNLPIKGEIEGIEIFKLLAENITSTREFNAKFEITPDYKRPEWLKKVLQ